jgi:hypothetical protein
MRHIKKNPVYYLQHLKEQAKLKKSQTSYQNENQEREQNFQLFFSGANGNRIQLKARRANEKSPSPCIRKFEGTRKRWGTPSTPNILKETLFDRNSRNESVDYENVQELIYRFKRLDREKQEKLLETLTTLEDASEF